MFHAFRSSETEEIKNKFDCIGVKCHINVSTSYAFIKNLITLGKDLIFFFFFFLDNGNYRTLSWMIKGVKRAAQCMAQGLYSSQRAFLPF